MNIRTSCLLLMAVAATGCWQKSVSPFYTTQDVVAEPKLIGSWRLVSESDDADPTIWTFTKTHEKEFDLVSQDKEERHEYEARVFKLGDRRFLDLLSKTRAVSTVPAHHLFQIFEVGTELKVTALNPDWMQKWLKKHPGSLTHIVVADPEHRDDRDQDEPILTADTGTLQKFIRDHLEDQDFFTGELVLKKESAATTGKPK